MMNATWIRSLRRITALLTFATALVLLLFAPGHVEFHVQLHLGQLSELFDSLLTAAIFYASIGLLKGKRGGWIAAVTVLSLSTIWEVLISRQAVPILALIPFIVLGFTLATYRFYSAPAERSDHRLRIVGLITIVTTLIGCLGYLLVALQTHREFSLVDAFIQSLRHMYSLNTSWLSIMHPHFHAHFQAPVLAYTGLFAIGVLNYSLVAIALLQPVVASEHDTRRRDVRKLLNRYGRDSEDFFKVFPRDKHYFTAPGINGFIAYAQHENICLMLADPIAPTRKSRQKLLNLFQLWCHENDLRPAAVPVKDSSAELYEKSGFSLLKIGENAIVDLKEFATTALRSKHFRNVINRFEKTAASVEICTSPHTPELIAEVREISEQWLARGHDERGFALGYFDQTYLQQCDLVIARDAKARAIGFINLLPQFDPARASFDLMRTASHAPKNTIDFLLARTCILLHERGVSSLDFGLAPLSGLKDTDKSAEKVLDFIAGRAARWYNFHGLRQFKNKFDPEWSATYLAYEGSSYRLMAYAVALLAVLDRKS